MIFTINCSECYGLCCRALYFSKLDGFPENKQASIDCRQLHTDYTCKIHQELSSLHYKGCLSYDCMNAGVLASSFYTKEEATLHKEELFTLFIKASMLVSFQYYLMDVEKLHKSSTSTLLLLELERILSSKEAILTSTPSLLQQEVARLIRMATQSFTKNTMKKNMSHQTLTKVNLANASMIQYDCSHTIFHEVSFIGADVRDCNVCNADLRHTYFLTQAQVNVMKGNKQTKLPSHLKHPSHWD